MSLVRLEKRSILASLTEFLGLVLSYKTTIIRSRFKKWAESGEIDLECLRSQKL